jgi:hypothetical protein
VPLYLGVTLPEPNVSKSSAAAQRNIDAMLSQYRALRFAISAGATCFATVAFAQAPNPALSVKKVKDDLYVVQGGGGIEHHYRPERRHRRRCEDDLARW